MCGICGFFAPEDKKLLKAMNSAIVHRGPDDEGYYSDSVCSLAMRRLSIIDVACGHQPMHNENNDIWIVFNGEIYNYLDLKKKLSSHRFYTKSDTEAIVHAYEEFDADCVKHLNGMFAFAIWDSVKKRIFIARDRFGEKPLYYTIKGGKLFFSSEIKSMLQNADIKRELNHVALNWYLSFRCNPKNETFFKGIYKLPPAHSLSYDGKSLKIERYWSSFGIKPDYSRDEASLVDEFGKRLYSSVNSMLMSEVPLGAYLSAGIDSASVVALMSRASSHPVKTFSVGFAEDSDELKGARLLASHFKTEHREIIIRQDSVNVLPEVVWHLDEPVADPTCIPIYLLSKNIKPYATVVLTGDGSDELLYGYEQIKLMSMHWKYFQKAPVWTRSALIAIMRLFPKRAFDVMFRYASSLGDKGFDRFYEFARTNDPVGMYLSLVSLFSSDEKKQLLAGLSIEFSHELSSFFKDAKTYDELIISAVRMDESNILADDMLMRSDKSTMAHSVEQRVPFLDHSLAEFIASVPPKYKLNGLQDKYILRKSMAKILPGNFAKRKKTRFFTPIHGWFEGELKDVSKQLLSAENCSKIGLSHEYIENIFKNYSKSRLYYGRQLWSLLVFRLWHRLFIEEGAVSAPSAKIGDFA